MARWGKTTANQAFFGPPPPSAPIERIGSLGSNLREKRGFLARQSSCGALGSPANPMRRCLKSISYRRTVRAHDLRSLHRSNGTEPRRFPLGRVSLLYACTVYRQGAESALVGRASDGRIAAIRPSLARPANEHSGRVARSSVAPIGSPLSSDTYSGGALFLPLAEGGAPYR